MLRLFFIVVREELKEMDDILIWSYFIAFITVLLILIWISPPVALALQKEIPHPTVRLTTGILLLLCIVFILVNIALRSVLNRWNDEINCISPSTENDGDSFEDRPT